ncbi:hypothetical protein [Streptomyces sp. NPDC001717]|uniref:hypothetical protein n=1 Tax=Streptomyces sp. NPDC001717 TaxID=3364604 RepID=UPI003694C19B
MSAWCEDPVTAPSSAPSATAKPSASAPAGCAKADPAGSGGGGNDCGKPPTPPAGVKIVEVGLHRDVSVFEAMDAHIDGCLSQEHRTIKEPFSRHGNIYGITLDAEGEVQTMRERWSV